MSEVCRGRSRESEQAERRTPTSEQKIALTRPRRHSPTWWVGGSTAVALAFAALLTPVDVEAQTVFTTDIGVSGQVKAFDDLGNQSTPLGILGVQRPGILKFDSAGNLYVLDYTTPGGGSKILYKRTPIGSLDTIATLPGGNHSYNSIAVADDGAVFLNVGICPGDDCHSEIWEVRQGQAPIVLWNSTGTGNNGPYGITFGPGGHLYFVRYGSSSNDFPNARMVRLTRAGIESTFFDFGVYFDILDLRFDSQGNALLLQHDSVSKISQGNWSGYSGQLRNGAYRLTIRADDMLFASGEGGLSGGWVQRVAPGGTVTDFVTSFPPPSGLEDDGFDTFPAVFCGDGTIAGSEECDDGNQMSGDGCSGACSCEGTCGDGMTLPPCESCDDGDLIDGNGCDSNCKPTGCGNGIMTSGEQCDDGNTTACDGCSPTCQIEVGSACGDGAVSAACGEQCDDANQADGDGCSASCQEQAASESSSATVSTGGTLTTDTESDGSTASDPLETSVTLPPTISGAVSISEASGAAAGQGFEFLGQAVTISAPTASAANPLVIVLRLDASRIPAGQTPATLELLKDGAPVVDCTGTPGVASPDPCVASRLLLGDGDIELTALTSTASVWGLAVPAHDSVVVAPKALRVRIPSSATSVSAKLSVRVVNADVLPSAEVPGHTIQLVAADGDCPPGTVAGLPDFDLAAVGAQDTVLLAGGARAIAKVPLTVSSAVFSTFNQKAPGRCRLRLSVRAVDPGNSDPNRSNDETTAELNVLDGTDPGQTQVHESVIESAAPVKINVSDGRSTAVKKVAVKVTNADILPAAEDPGHSIQIVAEDGDCPAGTVGVPDFSPVAGIVDTVTVAGGAKRNAKLAVTVNAAAFASPNGASPARCTALLRAVGPLGDSDASNDTTRLVIDVFDKNDY